MAEFLDLTRADGATVTYNMDHVSQIYTVGAGRTVLFIPPDHRIEVKESQADVRSRWLTLRNGLK